jgi:molybdenum-dependent DNA-binding transcriptional regulator ModE
LHLWFITVYIMVATDHLVSIKHLERELGVTYKTAWRMAHLISRQLLSSDVGSRAEGIAIDKIRALPQRITRPFPDVHATSVAKR